MSNGIGGHLNSNALIAGFRLEAMSPDLAWRLRQFGRRLHVTLRTPPSLMCHNENSRPQWTNYADSD